MYNRRDIVQHSSENAAGINIFGRKAEGNKLELMY